MAKHNSLSELFTDIADSIRAKTGGTDPIVADDFPEAIEGISSGGGGGEESVEDKIVTREITEYTNNRVTYLGNRALYGCANLLSVECQNLTSLGQYALGECKKLITIKLPIVRVLGQFAFYSCTALESIDLPNVYSIAQNCFDYCSALKKLVLPSLTELNGNYQFRYCYGLEMADFPVLGVMSTGTFWGCYSLKAVILRNQNRTVYIPSTDVLTNCYHFHGTVNSTYNPDGLKDGYIYVPAALVDSYKVATNWSKFADQIRAIEDYTVDGTITGDLDESKI